MKDQTTLLRKLSKMGLPFMEPQEDFDVNQTLAEVVKSNDTRLLESFPVLLLNAAKDYCFDYLRVNQHLKDANSREKFRDLLVLSVALYGAYHLRYLWATKVKKGFTDTERTLLKKYKSPLANSSSFMCAGTELSPSRLKQMFDMYFENDAQKNQQKEGRFETLSLEYAMSQFFSPKQKDLFKKKMEGLPLTKTEKEYFSRSVKKKVVALANVELHHMAQTLVVRS